MAKSTIFALHGFMGHANEWELTGLNTGKHVVKCLGFNELCLIHPSRGLNVWGDGFMKEWQEFRPSSSILLGYSLGGRLGMHALVRQTSYWKAAIIVSAHPGLSLPEERLRRIHSDKAWAQRFEAEPWNSVMQDWNAQAVFGSNSSAFAREEKDYSRTELAAALRHWSLGQQENLTDKIQELSLPILWVTGENDVKFTEIAKTLHFKHPKSRKWIASRSAHRVPWEQPAAFLQEVNTFIDSLSEPQ